MDVDVDVIVGYFLPRAVVFLSPQTSESGNLLDAVDIMGAKKAVQREL